MLSTLRRPRCPRLATAPAALLLLAAAAPPAAGQAPPGPVFEDRVAVSWVLVPVAARSGSDDLMDLDEMNFRLRVDGRPVEVASFDADPTAPLSLVWLQDVSGSMANGGKLEAGRRAFLAFLERARPGDEFAIATFGGGSLAVDVPFTGDRDALAEAAALWRGWSTTALHDAVAFVPEISAEGRNLRRAVVLVTDGVDNASTLPPEAAREVVRRARLPVYVLGLAAHGTSARAGDPSARFAAVLESLANASGGRYFPLSGPEEVEAAAASAGEELRRQVVLGFPAAAGPKRWRRIEVEVRGREAAELLFREGYLGGPPAGGGS